MFVATCTNTEKLPITSSPNTGGVNPKPAKVDGGLTITVVSGDGSFEQDPATPLLFFAVSGEETATAEKPDGGKTVYSVKIDADLGAGVETVEDFVELTVTSAKAAALGMSAGAAVQK